MFLIILKSQSKNLSCTVHVYKHIFMYLRYLYLYTYVQYIWFEKSGT